ncbi:MAG: zinc ribbon domain-containing protein [Promethearchaeota archaeon]|nr:MAG: zinc ribbon domain-containing protein [Candidatus Lokiarchaeota archaeon]
MVKKKYICSECGHQFSEELAQLIENGTQVYCENCGTPFSLEGKKFTEREYKPPEKIVPKASKKEEPKKAKAKAPKKKKAKVSTLIKAIKTLNDFSYIPILIVSILIFVGIVGIIFNPKDWVVILIRQISFGTAGLIITFYDKNVISKKINAEKYDEVFIESFGIGILGCIIYGSGVVILIKGILTTIYVTYTKTQEEKPFYNLLTSLKDSFLKISSKFGFIILILALHAIVMGSEPLYAELILDIRDDFPRANAPLIVITTFIVLFSIAFVSLLIHNEIKNKLLYNPDIEVVDFIKTLILGILATIFFASGIFILLEAVSLLIFYFVKPSEEELEKKEFEEPEEIVNPFKISEPSKIRKEEKEEGAEEVISLGQREKIEQEISKIKYEELDQTEIQKEEMIKESEPEPSIGPREEIQISKKTTEEKKPEEKIEEYKLKLHESLLPVKDKKDKKLVKKYFSKIFTILSKDIKEKIKDLDLSKKEKKEILRELAFLSREKQVKYINAVVNLYQEQIPKNLVERIRNLPNVKPEHYQKIVNELKYLDRDEQLRFINYLEKYA